MLARLRIFHRLLGGFAAVLALVAMIAAAGIWVTGTISAENAQAEKAARVAIMAGQIDRDVVHFRRQAREYTIQAGDSTRKAMDGAAEAVKKSLAAAEQMVDDPEQRQALNTLKQDYTAYLAILATVIAPVEEKARILADELRPHGSELTAEVSRLGRETADAREGRVLAELADVLGQARLRVSLYLTAPTSEDAESVRETLARAEALVAQTGHPALLAEKLRRYGGDFNALVVQAEAFAKGMKAGVPAGQKVGDGAQKLKDVAMTDVADARVAAQEADRFGHTTILAIGGFTLLIGIVLALVISRGLVRPIRAMTGAMTALAGGDLAVAVPGAERGDEIGEMARTVIVFKDNALQVRRMTAEQEAVKAQAEIDRKKAMNALADGFEQAVAGVVARVSAAASQMQAAAEGMSEAAARTSSQSMGVAAAAEQASSNVETVSAAAEELSASIGEIARQVERSRKIAESAVEEAAGTDRLVSGLAQSAARIGEVIKLITDIASQTNLLALNATIESARAGEAGKGFAVVAGEVKALAGQTARATDDIIGQIGEIQTATRDTVEAIRHIGATISEMNGISVAIAAAVEEQGAATGEIARNIQQAASGTQEVSSHIAEVTQTAGQTGKIAGEVLGAARDLSSQSGVLSEQVQNFVRSVRA